MQKQLLDFFKKPKKPTRNEKILKLLKKHNDKDTPLPEENNLKPWQLQENNPLNVLLLPTSAEMKRKSLDRRKQYFELQEKEQSVSNCETFDEEHNDNDSSLSWQYEHSPRYSGFPQRHDHSSSTDSSISHIYDHDCPCYSIALQKYDQSNSTDSNQSQRSDQHSPRYYGVTQRCVQNNQQDLNISQRYDRFSPRNSCSSRRYDQPNPTDSSISQRNGQYNSRDSEIMNHMSMGIRDNVYDVRGQCGVKNKQESRESESELLVENFKKGVQCTKDKDNIVGQSSVLTSFHPNLDHKNQFVMTDGNGGDPYHSSEVFYNSWHGILYFVKGIINLLPAVFMSECYFY